MSESTAWHAIPVPEDQYTELDRKIGFDQFKCSECGALLSGGICLNACHLGSLGKHRFQNEMLGFAARTKPKEMIGGNG